MPLRLARTAVLVLAACGALVATAVSAADEASTGPAEPVPAPFPALGVAAGDALGLRAPADRDRELDDVRGLGVGWVRADVAWDVVQPRRGRWNWAPSDAVVDGVRRRGLQLIATVGYTPPWANNGNGDHRFAPRDPAEFGAFAGAVARRYAPRGVHAYEIWNEPNIEYWRPRPDPVRYVAVLRAAAKAIRAADPRATIITGGMSPAGDSATTVSPHRWLELLYRAGARPWFDAIGHHPYVDADVGPDSTDPGNPWFQMAGSTPSIRSIQAAHGDAAKRIWATEVGCRRSSVDCAPRLARAAALWRTYPWAGVLAWFTYWDPNEYGLVDGDFGPRPTWYALHDAVAAG